MRYEPRLSPRAEREMEESWKLRREAVELLGLIVAEWKSDPMSVQCFDLRLVEKATKLVDRHAKVDIWAHDPLSHRFTVSILPLQSLHKVIK